MCQHRVDAPFVAPAVREDLVEVAPQLVEGPTVELFTGAPVAGSPAHEQREDSLPHPGVRAGAEQPGFVEYRVPDGFRFSGVTTGVTDPGGDLIGVTSGHGSRR